MPAATAAKQGGSSSAPARPSVPFLAGSYEYSEPITTYTATPGTTTQDNVVEITPGGFLRGVTMFVTCSGGTAGSGALAADAPWNLFSDIELNSIDGTNLLYPMGGYAVYLGSKFNRPWDGDPAADPGAVVAGGTTNPVTFAFNFRFFIESRMTIGVLPNTDARAQYRLKTTINTVANIWSTAPGTTPLVTVQINLETYAQPPSQDYAGNPIAQLPDGLVLQRFVSHEIFNINGGDQTVKSNRVGNLIRNEILVFRNSSSPAARVNLAAGTVIRWRIDNTQMLNEIVSRRTYENNRVYNFGVYTQDINSASPSIPTGVYVYNRFHNPGAMDGMYWLPTTEATFLQWEMSATTTGTLEIITEDFAPAGNVPTYLQGL